MVDLVSYGIVPKRLVVKLGADHSGSTRLDKTRPGLAPTPRGCAHGHSAHCRPHGMIVWRSRELQQRDVVAFLTRSGVSVSSSPKPLVLVPQRLTRVSRESHERQTKVRTARLARAWHARRGARQAKPVQTICPEPQNDEFIRETTGNQPIGDACDGRTYRGSLRLNGFARTSSQLGDRACGRNGDAHREIPAVAGRAVRH